MPPHGEKIFNYYSGNTEHKAFIFFKSLAFTVNSIWVLSHLHENDSCIHYYELYFLKYTKQKEVGLQTVHSQGDVKLISSSHIVSHLHTPCLPSMELKWGYLLKAHLDHCSQWLLEGINMQIKLTYVAKWIKMFCLSQDIFPQASWYLLPSPDLLGSWADWLGLAGWQKWGHGLKSKLLSHCVKRLERNSKEMSRKQPYK